MTIAQKATQFPWQMFKSAWKEGVSNAFVPKIFGGSGLNLEKTHLVAHQMRTQPKQLKSVMGAHYSAQIALSEAAQQKQERFYPLMTQYPVVAAAPTAESLKQTTKTSYKLSGEKYILNGSHICYTNADVASFYLVEATKESNSEQSTIFMLDKHQLGICLEPRAKENKEAGLDENSRFITFKDVTVSQDSIISSEGEGQAIKQMINVAMEEVML